MEPNDKESAKKLISSQIARAKKGGDPNSALAFLRVAEEGMKRWRIKPIEVGGEGIGELRSSLMREKTLFDASALLAGRRGYFNALDQVTRFEERMLQIAINISSGVVTLDEIKSRLGSDLAPTLESFLEDIKEERSAVEAARKAVRA